MKKIIALLGILVFAQACSTSSGFKGSYVQVGHSLGQVSEFKNKEKIDEASFKVKGNYNWAHIEYEAQKLTSKNAGEGALHNREWQWIGLGGHTNKGTDFTFYKDMKDTKNNFWKVSVVHTNKIRSRLSTLVGLNHYDTEHGGIKKSGGRRTTNLYGGMMYDVGKGFKILGDLTVGNNGSDFIQDILAVKLRYEF